MLLGLKENIDRWKPDMVIGLVGNNDASYVPYSDEPAPEILQENNPEPESFIEGLRVVQLWRLLSNRVQNKIGRIGWGMSAKEEHNVGEVPGVHAPRPGQAESVRDSFACDDLSEIEKKLGIAEIRIQQHCNKEAVKIIEEVMAVCPENQYALSLYADAKVDLGEYDAALRARKRLIDIDPCESGVLFYVCHQYQWLFHVCPSL